MKMLAAKNPNPTLDQIRVTLFLSTSEATLFNRLLGGSSRRRLREMLEANKHYDAPVTDDDMIALDRFLFPIYDTLDDVVRLGNPVAEYGGTPESAQLVKLMSMLSTIAKQVREDDKRESEDEASGD